MQKITGKTVEAFLDGREISIDNSEVRVGNNRSDYYLFGNRIAKHDLANGEIQINSKGYETRTTKNRINGIAKRLRFRGVEAPQISQRDHVWYLDDAEFPSNEWIGLADYDPDPDTPERFDTTLGRLLKRSNLTRDDLPSYHLENYQNGEWRGEDHKVQLRRAEWHPKQYEIWEHVSETAHRELRIGLFDGRNWHEINIYHDGMPFVEIDAFEGL